MKTGDKVDLSGIRQEGELLDQLIEALPHFMQSTILSALEDLYSQPTLLIVGGYPGSGKTTFLNVLRSNLRLALVESDYMKESINQGSKLRDSRHHNTLITALRNGHSCAIGDIIFVERERQDQIEQIIRQDVPNTQIRWLLFEPNWRQCVRNILDGDQDDKHAQGRIKHLFEHQEFNRRPGAHVVPVYSPIQADSASKQSG